MSKDVLTFADNKLYIDDETAVSLVKSRGLKTIYWATSPIYRPYIMDAELNKAILDKNLSWFNIRLDSLLPSSVEAKYRKITEFVFKRLHVVTVRKNKRFNIYLDEVGNEVLAVEDESWLTA